MKEADKKRVDELVGDLTSIIESVPDEDIIDLLGDGIMFVQGEKQFEGLIGLYQHNRVKFAIAQKLFKTTKRVHTNLCII